jgi:riboflavin synthase
VSGFRNKFAGGPTPDTRHLKPNNKVCIFNEAENELFTGKCSAEDMFTGIIEGFGTVSGIRPSGESKQITIDADFLLDGTKPGDSIAVSGACLTATMVSGRRFNADLSPETLTKTTLGLLRIGSRVNLERALRFSDRLGGHLVSGHIDGIGHIRQKRMLDNTMIVTFEVPSPLGRYFIEKGSVAVDGISLTVYDCTQNQFSVSIIPHTAKLTTLSSKKEGDSVNIETDMIGKYVERFIGRQSSDETDHRSQGASIDLEFLAKTGFLR